MATGKIDSIIRICQILIDDARACERNGELQLAASLYRLCNNHIEALSGEEEGGCAWENEAGQKAETEIQICDLKVQALLGQAYLKKDQEIRTALLDQAKALADKMQAKSSDLRFFIAAMQIDAEKAAVCDSSLER